MQTSENKVKTRTGLIDNPHLHNETEDYLIHLSLNTKRDNLPSIFGDIKFVCMGGTANRMKEFANLMAREINPNYIADRGDHELINWTESGNRFSAFKVGCVLCINHGIGYASITIVLHEVIKLLHYAGVEDPIIFRIGTSGGVGIPGGTVVIAETAVNDYLQECFEIPILGKKVKIPAILDQSLVTELKNLATSECRDFPIRVGKTMSHEHFYESVASAKASYCDNDDEERKRFFETLKEQSILNADMEVVAIAAITNRLKIKSAVVNVVVNDLLHPTEDGEITLQTLKEWQSRPQKIVAKYIKNYMENFNSNASLKIKN